MIRGLISAARGMYQETLKQDVIAANLANVSTSGYKRRTVSFSGFASALAQQNSADSANGKPRVQAAVGDPRATSSQDDSQGSLQTTGSNTDLAIEGSGFFVVQSKGGEELTRNGSFSLNSQGEIITPSGGKLMGQSGPITLNSTDWQIDPSGRVLCGGAVIDTLKIVAKNDTGGTSDVAQGDARIVQGAVEASNVSPMREMVGMIANLRSYEANQKTIQSIDHTLDKLINEAGKV